MNKRQAKKQAKKKVDEFLDNKVDEFLDNIDKFEEIVSVTIDSVRTVMDTYVQVMQSLCDALSNIDWNEEVNNYINSQVKELSERSDENEM
jgi:hypothetical protein